MYFLMRYAEFMGLWDLVGSNRQEQALIALLIRP